MIKPLRDFVLVKKIERTHKLPSGMVLPDTAKLDLNEAEVIAIGPLVGKDLFEFARTMSGENPSGGVSFDYMEVGDVVIFNQWGVKPTVDYDGQEYLLIQERDIFAVKRDAN